MDIRPDTLNIDETQIEEAISPRTRAIVPVHYAGVGCEMDPIMALAAKHDLLVIEDAAQGVCATYRGRPLGAIGHLGSLSFHETKNVLSGEGGALLLRDDALVTRAEILREKGTNRSAFFRGQVDKYTWVDLGSSFLPSEIIAAFLWAQLERAEELTARRLAIWQRYHDALADLEEAGLIRRPIVPDIAFTTPTCTTSCSPTSTSGSESFASSPPPESARCSTTFRSTRARREKVRPRAVRRFPITTRVSERLLRLPIWAGIEPHLDEVIDGSSRQRLTRGRLQ